jgi:hypothetical protein
MNCTRGDSIMPALAAKRGQVNDALVHTSSQNHPSYISHIIKSSSHQIINKNMATRHPQFGTLPQSRSNQAKPNRTVWLAMFFLLPLFGKPFAADGFLQNELPQFILLRAAHPQL